MSRLPMTCRMAASTALCTVLSESFTAKRNLTGSESPVLSGYVHIDNVLIPGQHQGLGGSVLVPSGRALKDGPKAHLDALDLGYLWLIDPLKRGGEVVVGSWVGDPVQAAQSAGPPPSGPGSQ